MHEYAARSRRRLFCHELYPSGGVEAGELERTSIIQDSLFRSFSACSTEQGVVQLAAWQLRLSAECFRSAGDVFQRLNDIASQLAS